MDVLYLTRGMDLLFSARLIYKEFSKKEKRQLTILFFSTTINGLVQALGIVSVMPLIALLTEPSLAETHKYFLIIKDILPVEFHQSLLLVLGLFSFAVLLLGNLFVIFDYWLTLRFFNITEFKLSIRLFRQYMNFDYLSFKKKRLSDMSRNVIHEVDRVIVGTLLAIVGLISDFIIAISIISLLLYVNFWVTVVASLLIGLMYSLIYFFVIKKIEHLGNEFSKQESRVFSSVKQNLELFREIRVARKFKYFMKKYTIPAKKITRSATRYNLLKLVPEQIIEIFAFGLVIFIAIYFSSKSETSALVISSVAFFAFAVYRLIPIVKDIFDGIEELKYLDTSLQNVVGEFKLDSSRPQDSEQHLEQKALDSLKSIEISNLSYRYPTASNFVFKNISQTIKVNSFTCVVGSSGVGKSTFFDLLVGLLEPLNGEILVNGLPLSSHNMDGWLNRLGYVPQNIQFFEATIAENIAFGFDRSDIDLDRVREVAKIAEIDDFINAELADQYQTIIGDGGLTLSGGQKQRIGLARCLYHSPQIILLDEATNELDLKTEKQILDNLLSIAKLTIVFITHKPSVYEQADEILDLSKLCEGER